MVSGGRFRSSGQASDSRHGKKVNTTTSRASTPRQANPLNSRTASMGVTAREAMPAMVVQTAIMVGSVVRE